MANSASNVCTRYSSNSKLPRIVGRTTAPHSARRAVVRFTIVYRDTCTLPQNTYLYINPTEGPEGRGGGLPGYFERLFVVVSQRRSEISALCCHHLELPSRPWTWCHRGDPVVPPWRRRNGTVQTSWGHPRTPRSST